jgi:hypothetical protein
MQQAAKIKFYFSEILCDEALATIMKVSLIHFAEYRMMKMGSHTKIFCSFPSDAITNTHLEIVEIYYAEKSRNLSSHFVLKSFFV